MKMKTGRNLTLYLALLLFVLSLSGTTSAQVTIGDGIAPQKFSILEIVSNKTGGMRLPHLTTAERDALSATTEFQGEDHRGDATTSINPGLGLGLTIYNTDVNCIEYWDGYKWVSLCLGTADIVLKSPCGDYDPQNPPTETADGTPSNCEYTPEDKPACVVPAGKAYDVYLTAGSAYATLTVDPLTSAFTVSFSPNNSSFPRNAVVRVVNNCTGEFKDFVFSQAGAICSGHPDPILNSTTLDLCSGGSVFAHVTNAVAGVDYIWTYAGVIVHTGAWYEIKRAGVYKVYTGLLGCGTAETLTVTDNSGSTSPSAITISATNGGILCSGGNVVLTASTTDPVLWYHDGIPLTGTNKNDNPLTLSGAAMAGDWFAAVVDPGGCVSNSSNVLTLIDNITSGSVALPIPVAEVNGQPLTGGVLVICKDGTLKLEVTNAAVYPAGTIFEWFDNGVSIGKGTAPVIYLVAPTSTNMVLSVTASDQSGSCPNTAVSQSTSVTLTAPNITAINNGQPQAPICGATAATLTADYTGAAAYEWLLNGITVPGQTTHTLQTTQTGNYTVRYRDNNGCWSKVSTSIQVVQSAPISMTWNPAPVDVIKDDTHTYSIIANPAAAQYQWSWNSTNPNAVVSISPIGDGSSAVVKYGDKTALPNGTQPNVEIVVQSVGHPCGDATLKQTIQVKDGCTTGTSVNLSPGGNITMTEGANRTFTATTNASNNNNDLRYEWFVGAASQGAPSSINTFSYTPANTGKYVVMVEVSNTCTPPGIPAGTGLTAQANITVKPDVNQYSPDTSGDFKLTGKDCFDVAQSNFNTTCGDKPQRPGDFLDGSRNWVEGKQWVYTFVEVNTTAYQNLQFVTDDPSVLLKTETSNTSTKPYTHTLVFDKSVLTKALGKDKANALTITVYALYEVFESGVWKKKRVELKIKVQDCLCGCGAFIAPGVWKVFMCHNLGADESLDPFTPAAGIHGAKYKFGAKNATLTMAVDQANSGVISNWSNTTIFPQQASGYWSSANNPCPDGFRVPSLEEWRAVANPLINQVTPTTTSTWNLSGSNFDCGIYVGSAMFLPAAGARSRYNGALEARGSEMGYWSTHSESTNFATQLYGNQNGLMLSNTWHAGYTAKAYGFSVRCIEE